LSEVLRLQAELEAIKVEKRRLEERERKAKEERKKFAGKYDELVARRRELVEKIKAAEAPYLSKLEEVRKRLEAEKEAATKHLKAELTATEEDIGAIAWRPRAPAEAVIPEEVSEVRRRQVASSPETDKGQEVQAWMKAKGVFTPAEWTEAYGKSGYAGYVRQELVRRGTLERMADGKYRWRG